MRKMKCIAIFMAIIALSFASCNGSGKSESEEKQRIELKPASEEISGQLEGCFTVVDKTYKVKEEKFGDGILTVELKRTDAPLTFDSEDRAIYAMGTFSQSAYVQVGFGIELLDAEGNVVDKTSATSGSYSPDEAVELINLKENQTGTIRFSVDDDVKDAVSFRITSAYEYGGAKNLLTTADDELDGVDDIDDVVLFQEDEVKTKSSAKSENWDSILDSYEKFANKYVLFYKKVKAGTITIGSPEYVEYTQEALDFMEKLSRAESEMTTAQVIRMNKIAARISQAAM